MKKLYIVAALLMAATAANAGEAGKSISFQIEGHKIRVEAPKNCTSLSCLQISAPSLAAGFKGKSKRSDDSNDVAANPEVSAQKSAAAPVDQAVAAPQPSVTSDPAPAPSTMASAAPILKDDIVTAIPPADTRVATAPASAPAATTPAAPAAAATTPVGIWATEDGKGNVRVEQCGPNICGYAANGEKILINMKPTDNKWTGKIHDPESGRTYASTIAMKGPNAMRVQGCAFGGMFCGGQTWKRVS